MAAPAAKEGSCHELVSGEGSGLVQLPEKRLLLGETVGVGIVEGRMWCETAGAVEVVEWSWVEL